MEFIKSAPGREALPKGRTSALWGGELQLLGYCFSLNIIWRFFLRLRNCCTGCLFKVELEMSIVELSFFSKADSINVALYIYLVVSYLNNTRPAFNHMFLKIDFCPFPLFELRILRLY